VALWSRNVDELDNVVPSQQLGRDHRRFSVVTERFNSGWRKPAGHLEAVLGHAMDSRSGRHLAQAYGLIANVMVAAAEGREDIAPAYWDVGSDATCEVSMR
jgi:hypothetical protein